MEGLNWTVLCVIALVARDFFWHQLVVHDEHAGGTGNRLLKPKCIMQTGAKLLLVV